MRQKVLSFTKIMAQGGASSSIASLLSERYSALNWVRFLADATVSAEIAVDWQISFKKEMPGA